MTQALAMPQEFSQVAAPPQPSTQAWVQSDTTHSSAPVQFSVQPLPEQLRSQVAAEQVSEQPPPSQEAAQVSPAQLIWQPPPSQLMSQSGPSQFRLQLPSAHSYAPEQLSPMQPSLDPPHPAASEPNRPITIIQRAISPPVSTSCVTTSVNGFTAAQPTRSEPPDGVV